MERDIYARDAKSQSEGKPPVCLFWYSLKSFLFARADQVWLDVNFRADPGLYIWQSLFRHEVACLSVRAHQTPSNRPTLAGVEVYAIRVIVGILDLIYLDLIRARSRSRRHD
jgi:hypothetical protein